MLLKHGRGGREKERLMQSFFKLYANTIRINKSYENFLTKNVMSK